MVTKLSQLIPLAKERPIKTVAVAQAADLDVLQAVIDAKKQQIALSILVGKQEEIERVLIELGENPKSFEILHAETNEECAKMSVSLIREGRAKFLMKGLLSTGELMKAVIDKENGLRTGRILSHTMFYETPGYHKLLCITDGGMNTFPDLEKKAGILENALEVVGNLGIEKPICACVCGAEAVDPKIQSTVDAKELSLMTERFSKYNATVFGPVGLDLAISPQSCQHKGYKVKGGGDADILLVPTYEVGNGIGKAMTYFSGAQSAGIITGALCPIVLVSRADSAQTKLLSIALASVVNG